MKLTPLSDTTLLQIICCGIILYIENISFADPIVVLALFCSMVWPLLLLLVILYSLAHCVRVLLEKIINSKQK